MQVLGVAAEALGLGRARQRDVERDEDHRPALESLARLVRPDVTLVAELRPEQQPGLRRQRSDQPARRRARWPGAGEARQVVDVTPPGDVGAVGRVVDPAEGIVPRRRPQQQLDEVVDVAETGVEVAARDQGDLPPAQEADELLDPGAAPRSEDVGRPDDRQSQAFSLFELPGDAFLGLLAAAVDPLGTAERGVLGAFLAAQAVAVDHDARRQDGPGARARRSREDVARAVHGHPLMVGRRAPVGHHRRQVDDGAGAVDRPRHRLGVGHVAAADLDTFGPFRAQRLAGQDERRDAVAVGDEAPQQVTSDEAGGTGDQDGTLKTAHGGLLTGRPGRWRKRRCHGSGRKGGLGD